MKAGYEIRMNDSHLEVIRHEAANIKQLQKVQRISAQLKGVDNSACEDHWQATEKQPNSERVLKVLAEKEQRLRLECGDKVGVWRLGRAEKVVLSNPRGEVAGHWQVVACIAVVRATQQ